MGNASFKNGKFVRGSFAAANNADDAEKTDDTSAATEQKPANPSNSTTDGSSLITKETAKVSN